MQKMTSITSSIYEIIYLKVFFKNLFKKILAISRLWTILHNDRSIKAIPSICNQRSLPYLFLSKPMINNCVSN